MSIIVTVDGVPVTHDFAPSALNITHRADGEASAGGIPFEDPDGTLTLVGHRPVTVEEDECSQPRLFTGWITQRDMGRAYDDALIVSDARIIDTTMVDLNSCLAWRQITGADGNRPAETWATRLTWILGSDYLSEWISDDETWIVTNTVAIEAADYRGSYPTSVLDDLVDRSGGAYVYRVFWDAVASEVRLFFDNDVEVIGACPLSISNVIADVDYADVFPPDNVARLAREPDQTYSDVTVVYDRGAKKLNRYRASTATTYVRRGTTIQRPYTKSLATATAQAEKWLDKHAVETDRITCTIRVPAASVGLIQAGQSIAARFSHLGSPYSAAGGATMRIVSCSPKPTDDLANYYDVALELVYRPTVAPATPTCSYIAPEDLVPFTGYSSVDALGGKYGIQYVPAASPLAVTATLQGAPSALYGTANSGNWGVDPGVWGGGTASATWTWDLDSIGSPPICVIFLGGASLTGDLPDDACTVEASNDGTNWTEIVASDEVGALFFCAEPYPQYRYWRITWTFTKDPGLQYFEGLDLYFLMLWSGTGVVPDTIIDLGPTPGATTTHTTDPTVDDDAAAGYTVGSVWINETDDTAFILVDSTVGAAVWVETTGAGVTDHGALTGLTDDDHTQYVLKRYGGKEVLSTVAATGATETIDLANGNVFDETLTADCTLTFAGATAGVACSFTLLLRQDGTGGWDTTWPGSVVWAGGTAPTLDTTASTVSVLTFFTLDGGTVWYGFSTGGGGGTPGDTVEDETTYGITPDAGAADEYSRADHTHGSPPDGRWEVVMADSVAINVGTFATSANQTVGSTTTAYAVAFDVTLDNDGLVHSDSVDNSHIGVTVAGEYLVTVSAVADADSAGKHIAIWMAVDGTNIDDSGTVGELANGAESVIAVSYVMDLHPGQYFQVMYRSDSTGVRLLTTAAGASPTRPRSPAVVVSVTLIAPDTGSPGSSPQPLSSEDGTDWLYGWAT